MSCSKNNAETAYQELQEFKKGTDINKVYNQYQKIYQSFSESKYAEEALFYIGYMNHNNFHQLDSARHYFNLFIEKFPNSDLVASAKFEIDNLGVPPDDLPFLKEDSLNSKTKKVIN
jgi:outer membrane protein assembly factor BamD (BamD/ComL family)